MLPLGHTLNWGVQMKKISFGGGQKKFLLWHPKYLSTYDYNVTFYKKVQATAIFFKLFSIWEYVRFGLTQSPLLCKEISSQECFHFSLEVIQNRVFVCKAYKKNFFIAHFIAFSFYDFLNMMFCTFTNNLL